MQRSTAAEPVVTSATDVLHAKSCKHIDGSSRTRRGLVADAPTPLSVRRVRKGSHAPTSMLASGRTRGSTCGICVAKRATPAPSTSAARSTRQSSNGTRSGLGSTRGSRYRRWAREEARRALRSALARPYRDAFTASAQSPCARRRAAATEQSRRVSPPTPPPECAGQ